MHMGDAEQKSERETGRVRLNPTAEAHSPMVSCCWLCFPVMSDDRFSSRSVISGAEKFVVHMLAWAHGRNRMRAGCRVLLDLAEQPTRP